MSGQENSYSPVFSTKSPKPQPQTEILEEVLREQLREKIIADLISVLNRDPSEQEIEKFFQSTMDGLRGKGIEKEILNSVNTQASAIKASKKS